VLNAASPVELLGEILILEPIELFLGLCFRFFLFFARLVFATSLVHDDVALLTHLVEELILFAQVLDLAHINLGAGALQILAHHEVIRVGQRILHVAEVDDFCALANTFRQLLLRLANLVGLHLKATGVNVSQNVSHLAKVPVGDHAVSLVQHQHVDHGQSVLQIGHIVVTHEFPEAARRGNNDGWLVAKQAHLLLNRHTTDDSCHLNRLLVLHRDNSFDHVFDLNGELSRGAENEPDDAIELELGLLATLTLTVALLLLLLLRFLDFAQAQI